MIIGYFVSHVVSMIKMLPCYSR